MRLVYIVCLSVLLSLITPTLVFAIDVDLGNGSETYDIPVDGSDGENAPPPEGAEELQIVDESPNSDLSEQEQRRLYGEGRYQAPQVVNDTPNSHLSEQEQRRLYGEGRYQAPQVVNDTPNSHLSEQEQRRLYGEGRYQEPEREVSFMEHTPHSSMAVPESKPDRPSAMDCKSAGLGTRCTYEQLNRPRGVASSNSGIPKAQTKHCHDAGLKAGCNYAEIAQAQEGRHVKQDINTIENVVHACKGELNADGTDTSGAFSCAKTECTIEGVYNDSCYKQAISYLDQMNKDIKSFSDKHEYCVDKRHPEANRCCGPNLAESSCGNSSMSTLIQGVNDINETMKIAASYTSAAAVCQANKKSYQIASGLLITATGICTKSAFECHEACGVSEYEGYCTKMLGKNGTDTDSNNVKDCQAKINAMKSKRNSCFLLQAGNLAKAGLTHTMNKYAKKSQECASTLADGNVPECNTPEDFATKPECETAQFCKQAGTQDLEICKDQAENTGNANVNGQTLEGIDTASNSNASGLDGLESAFDEEDGEQGIDPFAGLEGATPDSGGDQQASGSGGGALASGGGSGGGGGSGSRGGRAKPGKDRNILRGTSSGNGYVSRFRGGGSGGGYKSKTYSRSSGSRGGSKFPKFNLKKFLPKSKKITKGRLKGYNRLPSGNLMVPQSLDIFDVHHKSYQNACKRGPIIKGCGPRASKKLGFAPSVRDLNSRYKAQLALQKETQKQRLSRSGIRVRSLKNNISKQANTTYYQIKYLNKNKLRSLPAKDPLAALGNKSSHKGKYKDWHKMQSWVNSKTRGTFKKPTSGRLPASVK